MASIVSRPDSPASQARATWPVLRAVGAHVRLTPHGRYHTGLCPSHGDARRPSLVVFPATDTWKCFTCNAHGDGLDSLARQTGRPLRAIIHDTLDGAPLPAPRPTPLSAPVSGGGWDHARPDLPPPAHHLEPVGRAPRASPGAGNRSRAGGRWRLAGPGGLALPVQDAQGRVQALHVRADAGPGKYVWWSTPGRPGGASSGAPVHVAGRTAPRTTVWITEGPLKATVAADRLGVPVIGVPGATAPPSDTGPPSRRQRPPAPPLPRLPWAPGRWAAGPPSGPRSPCGPRT